MLAGAVLFSFFLSGLANDGVSLLKEDEPIVQGLALISNTH